MGVFPRRYAPDMGPVQTEVTAGQRDAAQREYPIVYSIIDFAICHPGLVDVNDLTIRHPGARYGDPAIGAAAVSLLMQFFPCNAHATTIP